MNIEEVRSTTFVGCVEQLSKVSKPVVATVNGLAAVGGCELVEMCDIVIAGQSAKFSHPEITLAAMPGAGGTQRLSRVVGKHIAMDMLLTGRPLSAQEALIAGLVSRVVPDEELVSTAWQIAEKVAAFSNPVARRIKACVTQTQIGLDRGLVMERDSFHRCFEEHDFKEGLDAFLNRREPQFLHQ